MHPESDLPAVQASNPGKPDDCIRVIIKKINSFGIFTKGMKINQLNKICRQSNTDILAG
jgi:hypothetical protein